MYAVVRVTTRRLWLAAAADIADLFPCDDFRLGWRHALEINRAPAANLVGRRGDLAAVAASRETMRMSDVVAINLGLILLIASVVAMISRRMRLPYSVGLVAAGVLLAQAPPIASGVLLSPEGIYTILLPPLIFEAALQIRWPPFRRDLPVILTLAFAGVAIAAAIVAAGIHFLVGWSWIGALLFGVLIAATDPVSVIAAFKEIRVAARLSLLVEAESLLNDGAAAVGFAVLLAVAGGSDLDPTSISVLLVWKALGGFIVGGALAWGLLLLAGRTEDHLVEITLTTIAAYGSFLIAERVETCGVLASLTAGMVVGNIGSRGYISQSGRSHVLSFWRYAALSDELDCLRRD